MEGRILADGLNHPCIFAEWYLQFLDLRTFLEFEQNNFEDRFQEQEEPLYDLLLFQFIK